MSGIQMMVYHPVVHGSESRLLFTTPISTVLYMSVHFYRQTFTRGLHSVVYELQYKHYTPTHNTAGSMHRQYIDCSSVSIAALSSRYWERVPRQGIPFPKKVYCTALYAALIKVHTVPMKPNLAIIFDIGP